MASNLIFRKVVSTDTAGLYRFLQDLSPDSKSRFGPHPFDYETIAGICNTSGGEYHYYIAELPDYSRIVAYSILKQGILHFERFRFENYGLQPDDLHDFVLAPAVADDFQSKGVGSMMFEYILSELKTLNAKRVLLWGGVQKSNLRAVNFYQKYGFRMLGEFEYNGINCDMVLNMNDLLYRSPSWIQDLIIYEINPYGFTTTPNNLGETYNGTFNLLTEKLDYLKDLGITGIWLAGFSEATAHFKGIRSVYACMRPDRIDCQLGTEQDLKDFINHAHEHGIKVFLEVVTHGVTNNSVLITEHPDWFEGSSWGMTDYNYNNSGFRKWWIDTWVRYVVEFKADGFRLDGPNGVQPTSRVLQIWDEIIDICGQKGMPVLVFPENAPYHFQQGLNESLTTKNVAKNFSSIPKFRCKAISNHDHGMDTAGIHSCYRLNGSRYVLAYEFIFGYNIPLLMSGEEFQASYQPAKGLQLNLFGGGGENSWLYGNCLDWNQLDTSANNWMHNDFRTILRIKHQNRDLLHYNRLQTQIVEVPFTCNIPDAPVPYIRYKKGEKAILVVGNDTRHMAEFILYIPIEILGSEHHTVCNITDLWTNESYEISLNDLKVFKVNVLPDFTKGGGFRVLRLDF